MKHDPRIWILTAGYGDGHLQAAHSLKQSLSELGVTDIRTIDLMEKAHPVINSITKTLYIKSMLSSQFGFDYYGWSYYLTREAKPNMGLNRFINNLGKKKLNEMIGQERPDAVINTFPFGAAPEVCGPLGIPSFTVVTDYSLHSRWIQPAVDKYYVATEELREQLLSDGFSKDRIEVSGIPIRKQFENDAESNGTNPFSKLSNGKEKLIVILAGSYGVLSDIDDMLQSLQDIPNCQIAVVCGRNAKLEQKLRLQYGYQRHLHVYGFVQNIHELMSVASCIITKAGGITLSEALALKVPIFIFKPFAGQEKENAVYLEKKGVASISNEVEELSLRIRHFVSDPRYSEEMKRKMETIHKKCASLFIANDVLRLIDTPELLLI